MLISFAMPVYKKDEYLREAIDSVLGQTFKNIELVIVDDATPKKYGIKEIVEYFMKQSKRVRYYRNPINMGVAFTRNFANMKAKGEIICVQDPDDLAVINRAAIVNNYFKKHPEVDIMYGACEAINSMGKHLGRIESQDFNVNRLRSENYISHPTVAYRKNIGVKYRNGLRFIDDWYFYLDCVTRNKRFGWVLEPLSVYRAISDGLTFKGGYKTKKKEKAKADLRKEFKNIEEDIAERIDESEVQQDRLKRIAELVPFGSSVLEMGCNTGFVMKYLEKKKCNIEGIEIAKNLVKICRKKGLKVTEADVREYTNCKKRDRIILGDILEHFEKDDVQKILNNAVSMLKKNGKIIITLPYEHGIYSKKYVPAHKADYGLWDIRSFLPEMIVESQPIICGDLATPLWLIMTARNP